MTLCSKPISQLHVITDVVDRFNVQIAVGDKVLVSSWNHMNTHVVLRITDKSLVLSKYNVVTGECDKYDDVLEHNSFKYWPKHMCQPSRIYILERGVVLPKLDKFFNN